MSKIDIIVGPTASGKSAAALKLAQEVPSVIINADSMQIYAEFPILTAQPSAGEQALVPHVLYGVLSVEEKWDAAQWATQAAEQIQTAWDVGKRPIIVGGTGLYVQTLMQGIAPIPEIPKAIRQNLTAKLEAEGRDSFYQQLIAQDPDSAHLHVGDTQRILRAMEVLEATGKPLSHWHSLPKRTFLPANPGNMFHVKHLLPDREVLYARCNERFVKMLDEGAIEEVQHYSLEKRVPIIGVPEIQSYLRGDVSRETMIEKATQATRNYAKRQFTWFRNQTL